MRTSSVEEVKLGLPSDLLMWPFFDEEHRHFVSGLASKISSGLLQGVQHHNVDEDCQRLVKRLGGEGLLRACVPAAYGGLTPSIDSRTLCLAREILAFQEPLADFAFAMQGLGSGPISLAGSDSQKKELLPAIARGDFIPAFALSEADAGSDVARMSCEAAREGDGYLLNGEKTWISNGGIADFYVVFARSPASQGTSGISAFIVRPEDPGFHITTRIRTIAPHPLATLRFVNLRLLPGRLIGPEGEGFKLAMRTLDIFRASVAAAAVGFARRALFEALQHSKLRKMFGGTLADLQMTQGKIGDMAALIDASALLTYRAAWLRDRTDSLATCETAMAKMTATENAQLVIDAALQIFGARGVMVGETLEQLYREIRALRIYEGATEVQRLIIARHLLRQGA